MATLAEVLLGRGSSHWRRCWDLPLLVEANCLPSLLPLPAVSRAAAAGGQPAQGGGGHQHF